MTRPLYDFLADSVLFDEDQLKGNFQSIPLKRLESELTSYRDHIVQQQEHIKKELVDDDAWPASTSIYFDTVTQSGPPISMVKQCGLYFDRMIIDDPLSSILPSRHEVDAVVNNFLGHQPPALDREEVAKCARLLKLLAPAVARGIVCVVPVTMTRERGPSVPIRFSPSSFIENLPPQHLEWIHQQAKLSPVHQNREEGTWYTVLGEPLVNPCRAIAVDFGGPGLMLIYHLFETEVREFDEETGRFAMLHRLGSGPPDEGLFRQWVFQSINQAGGAVLSRIAGDLWNCRATNSSLLTTSRFVSEFLRRDIGATRQVESEIAELALRMEVPVLSGLSLDELLTVRSLYDESFQAFRLALRRQLNEIAQVSDPEERARRLSSARYELTEIRTAEVDQEVRRIRKSLVLDGAVGVASLMAAIPTQGLSLGGTLLAAADGYRSIKRLQGDLRSNPGHFLWQLEKAATGQGSQSPE